MSRPSPGTLETMATEYSESVRSFWSDFADEAGVDAPFQAWAFGSDDMPELATTLALLVRDGPKRATTALPSSFDEDDPFPVVGAYSVVLDGNGEPVCIIRTTRVDTVRFGDVDEEFAWVEGEGDRTLEYWRKAHMWFFEADGTPITDDDLVVLETFDKVWPPEAH
jgi:uncharacterized protein YhfF